MSRANTTVHPIRQTIKYCGGPLDGESDTDLVGGLTIREHFAAMAMQGLFASGANEPHGNYEWMASRAVTAADMLLAELAKAKP